MGWLGKLIEKFPRRGSPVREVVESVGEKVLPRAVVDVIEAADKLGVDTAIEKRAKRGAAQKPLGYKEQRVKK